MCGRASGIKEMQKSMSSANMDRNMIHMDDRWTEMFFLNEKENDDELVKIYFSHNRGDPSAGMQFIAMVSMDSNDTFPPDMLVQKRISGEKSGGGRRKRQKNGY
jgi:hypothetical protein